MSTSRKLKSHSMRKGKNQAPHKGVKRGGRKRKYQKGNMKSRKRYNDGSCLGRKRMNGHVLTGVPVANLSFPYSQSQFPLPLVTPPAGSALVDFKRHQAATENRKGTAKEI
ncbi:hypothetical protein DBR06_SOUSAS1710015 [Sousa chinensis]|uniref:Spermatid nuclear transition protein 1 n=1 Tax=Sousa chinensis TaxID=103600 RepID=A0A484GTP0_SOUCH|nr:hypothetical protein DBR06_SOUSAS1710015 [Sousa chinensis]